MRTASPHALRPNKVPTNPHLIPIPNEKRCFAEGRRGGAIPSSPTDYNFLLSLVPMEGIEPPHPYEYQILSLARLPIPPHRPPNYQKLTSSLPAPFWNAAPLIRISKEPIRGRLIRASAQFARCEFARETRHDGTMNNATLLEESPSRRQFRPHAKTSFTTCPCTSVSRRSMPFCLTVNFS